MPGFDGTGPSGKGPMTGRKRGICGFFNNSPENKYPLVLKLMPILLPVAVAIVHDAFTPDSVTRKIAKTLIKSFSQKDKNQYLKIQELGQSSIKAGKEKIIKFQSNFEKKQD